jgi:hypothetical protein
MLQGTENNNQKIIKESNSVTFKEDAVFWDVTPRGSCKN